MEADKLVKRQRIAYPVVISDLFILIVQILLVWAVLAIGCEVLDAVLF